MVGISIGIAVTLAVLLLFLRSRRRKVAKLAVAPTVTNLNSLRNDESPLIVINRGRSDAREIVVSMCIRETTFEFDEIASLAPENESALTWRALGIGAKWLRATMRTAVLDAQSELRLPIAIHYRDTNGVERTAFQVLHCDEQMRIRITDD